MIFFYIFSDEQLAFTQTLDNIPIPLPIYPVKFDFPIAKQSYYSFLPRFAILTLEISL